MQPPYRLVFVSSLAALSFEILLLRIFSIRLSYHYASLIISLSMAGLVIGSLLVFLRQRCAVQLLGALADRPLSHLAAAIAVSCPATFIVLSAIPLDHVRMLWENTQVAYLVFFIVACMIPFFLYGVFISAALSAWSEKAGQIYASDLAGGAAGLLAVMILMDHFKAEYVLTLLAIFVGSVIISVLKTMKPRVLVGLLLAVLCVPIGLDVLPIRISTYKGLMQALKDDGASHVATFHSTHSRLDLFENPRMKFAPGLSLAFTGQVPGGIGMALDGEIVGTFIDRQQKPEGFGFISYLPSALPYLLAHPKNALIIGARNGIDLIQPEYFGVRDIHITENDASILKFLASPKWTNRYAPKPVSYASGRNILKNLPRQRLELIFLSRTGFFPSGNFGLQEDYDLTVEAIETYLGSLEENGILFIQMFLLPPPRTELRLAGNIRAALNRMGIASTGKHLIIYRSWDTINFLLKRNGFSQLDLQKIIQFLSVRQFDLLYPDMTHMERFIAGLDYPGLFQNMLSGDTSTNFQLSYPFDIRETTDDRPFFHYFLKFSNVPKIYELAGEKWAYFLHEGMFLPFTLMLLIILAVVVFAVVLLVSQAPAPSAEARLAENGWPDSILLAVAYFALIGFAFMLVEIFFIHRLILSFGSPVRAFSITLVLILVSAGAGSLVSGWIKQKAILWTMGLAPLFAIICYFFFHRVDETKASAALIVPIGMVLGFFFPAGLRFLANKKRGGVPLAYGANGAASIISPSLASLLAVGYGCNILLILAAILYLLAIAVILPSVLGISRATKG